jgi:hypothetical protein
MTNWTGIGLFVMVVSASVFLSTVISENVIVAFAALCRDRQAAADQNCPRQQ